jgi:kynurenine formamidase
MTAAGASGPFDGWDVVDLSLTLAEDLPCWWPSHMAFQQRTFNYFADRALPLQTLLARAGAYHTRWLLIDEHTGTHADAPAHFIPPPDSDLPAAGPSGEVTVDKVPLTQVMGPAAVVEVGGDLDAEPGRSPFITPGHLRDFESAHGPLAAGEVVLFRTGWDRRYRPLPEGKGYLEEVLVGRLQPGWPAPAVDTMQLLLERGVRCVGIDAPTMGAAHDGAPVHLAGLGAGAVFIEGLTGLDRLPPRGAWFCFAPLKLAGGTGAPGRAFALVRRA